MNQTEPKILVTGFGPFAATDDNPSAVVAELLGWPFAVLPVSYEEVDDWHESNLQEPPEVLVHLGYAKRLRITPERVAKNQIGSSPDVHGFCKPGPISGLGADLVGNLWQVALRRSFIEGITEWSDDAGDYLCNYIYYQSLRRLPHCRVGFIHLPGFDVIPRETTVTEIRNLILQSL